MHLNMQMLAPQLHRPAYHNLSVLNAAQRLESCSQAGMRKSNADLMQARVEPARSETGQDHALARCRCAQERGGEHMLGMRQLMSFGG